MSGGVRDAGSMLSSLAAGVVHLSLYKHTVVATVRRAWHVWRAVVGAIMRSARAWTASSLARCVGAAPRPDKRAVLHKVYKPVVDRGATPAV